MAEILKYAVALFVWHFNFAFTPRMERRQHKQQA